MDYAGGFWGYEPNENLKRIQIRAMRCFLGVYRYAPLVGVEGEMGWTTPAVCRKLEILMLWNKLMSLEEDRLPRQVFNNMSYTDHPWVSNIKEIFHLLDASYVFHNNVPIRNFKTFINFANKKLMKEYETDEWIKRVDVTPKLEIYSFYKRHYEKQSYCEVMLTR